VTNTGKIAADEVVQVYCSGAPADTLLAAGASVAPNLNLVGFTKVYGIKPGATAVVKLPISADYYSTAKDDGSRSVVPGSYIVSVGGHQPGDAEGDAGTSGKCASQSVVLH
jgi:beta-glucosidase